MNLDLNRPCEDCRDGIAIAQCRHCMLCYCAECGRDPARCMRCFSPMPSLGQHEPEEL